MKFVNNYTGGGAQSKVSQNLLHHFRVLLIILLVCGFNFNFYSCSNVNRMLIVSYCILLTAAITYSTVTCCVTLGIPQNWSLVQYVLSVFVILILKSNIKIYFKKLSEIDKQLRINARYYCQHKKIAYFYTSVICVVRFFYTLFYCNAYNCYNSLGLFLISQFSLFALNLFRAWGFFLFNTIRYRLKVLRLRLEDNSSCNFYLYAVDKKITKERKIPFCLNLYKNLADVAEYIIPQLSASMFIGIVCSLPKLILNTYYILLLIENKNQLYFSGLLFASLHISQICIFIFSSCIVVELYTLEIENMQRILINKLIYETNETTRQEIKMFLRYTQVRTFKYKIWRIIPLNLQLPLELLNICMTYVIVLINFTHLF